MMVIKHPLTAAVSSQRLAVWPMALLGDVINIITRKTP
jgi:hypothetical protein